MDTSGGLQAVTLRYVKKKVPGTYLLGGEMGHRCGADALAKTKIPTLDGNPALVTQVVVT
jgi:hypothetical protein